MKTNRYVASLAMALAVCVPVRSAECADHGDAPLVRLDTRRDINDVYVFQSPSTPANTVLVMTTNPVAGITGPLTYDPATSYEIVIDNDGDSRDNIVFRFKFKRPTASSVQSFTVTRVERNGNRGGRVSRIAAGSTGTASQVNGGGQVIAGLFDDPFFFDLLSFRNDLQFCGSNAANFFRGLNTLAMVLEVPSSSLLSAGGGTSIGVHGRTIVKGRQIDRMGRPAINTVLVTSANKDLFNRRRPVDDSSFRADAISIITSLGNTAENAQSLANTLFPDLLTFDTASTEGFLNGRKLEDDVIDAELKLLTNNDAAGDCVANDSAFRSQFPYLAQANP